MNIAIFADNFYPEVSGIADSILLNGNALAQMWHNVTFFVPEYSEKDYQTVNINTNQKNPQIHKNNKIIRIKSFGINSPSWQWRWTIPNILRGFWWYGKFDIIHSHSFLSMWIDAWIMAKINRIPLIGTNHTFIEAFLDFVPKYIACILPKYQIRYYNLCNHVTAPSRFALDDMKNKGIKSENEVISNPIDEKFYNKDIHIKNNKEFTFIYIWRISNEKNIEILIDSFANFIKKYNITNARLQIVWWWELENKIKSKIIELWMQRYIYINSSLVWENKYRLYEYFDQSDAFVIPSQSETQSMITLQAMASWLHILVSDIWALRNIAFDNRWIIFDQHNKNDITEKMLYIYKNHQNRLKNLKKSQQYVKQFTIENIAKKREELYISNIKTWINWK